MFQDRCPGNIERLKYDSSLSRKRVIKKYLSITSKPIPPPYLKAGDIIASHLQRAKEDLSALPTVPWICYGHLSFTRGMLNRSIIMGRGGFLAEICMGIMEETLKTGGNLKVAAGFFSSMVASIDDYLDKEGNFNHLGERLLYLSHAYRDLMDLALEEEVQSGSISRKKLYEIKSRLFKVTKTLAQSECAGDADRYLYEKSCGDMVVEVLFPASSESGLIKGHCQEVGRLIGEAGQLIDDIIDYEHDRTNGKRNYIVMTGMGIPSALTMVEERLVKARVHARELLSRPILWILNGLEDLVSIFRRELHLKRKISPSALRYSRYLPHMMPNRVSADEFLLWF